MNIAIVGAGLSGAYLACLLKKRGQRVRVFEMSEQKNHWPICAWAAPRYILSKFSEQADLNFDEYILHQGRTVQVLNPGKSNSEYRDIRNFVTFDKHRWLYDLLNGIDVTYGFRCTGTNFPANNFDYVIDCTGVHRALLPRPQEDFLIPSYEYLVENVKGMDNFFIMNYQNAKGYFWYFPLGGGHGYVGAGDFDRLYDGFEEFFKQHPESRIQKKIGRPIRLCPPTRMEPFYDKNIIGVGESIGCVFPITGEGIAPSLQSCNIFLRVFDKNNQEFDLQEYRRIMFSAFAYYDDAYRIIKNCINKRSSKLIGTLGDIKRLVINNPSMAPAIKKIAEIVEIFSIVLDLSDKLYYPIISLVQFYSQVSKLKHESPSARLLLMTSSYFPIVSQQDLENKASDFLRLLLITILSNQ